MKKEDNKSLEQVLWDIANELRGKMSADEFRDYILGFIFYKYLSENMLDYADKLLNEGKKEGEESTTYLSIDGSSEEGRKDLEAIKVEALGEEGSDGKLGYFLKPSELFSEIAKRGNGNGDNFVLDDLTNILSNIERSTMGHKSEYDFVHLFEDLDLTSTKLGKTVGERNRLIVKVLSHLNKVNFGLENKESDVLGDAYEYLISQFAAGAGKKAGEFYTPQQVSKILARIVVGKKSKLKSAYDPACGSGSLLLRVKKEANITVLHGQELNRTTYNLARMNMIIHGVHYRDFDIKQEDTLEKPQHKDKKFEAIVANPPFSAHWSANPLHMTDERFSQYGKLAPKTKADFAFVQHMIYHLDDSGIMAIVLPHGVLFRGASEGHIRRYLIENNNYIDAVIGLPANVFYGTSIPACILVFKKCREASDDIFFMDASLEFEKAKNKNILTDGNVDRIVETYESRKEIEKYSRRVSLAEIKENDYNLNISRYIDTSEEEEVIDIEATLRDINDLEGKEKEIDSKLNSYLKELGF